MRIRTIILIFVIVILYIFDDVNAKRFGSLRILGGLSSRGGSSRGSSSSNSNSNSGRRRSSSGFGQYDSDDSSIAKNYEYESSSGGRVTSSSSTGYKSSSSGDMRGSNSFGRQGSSSGRSSGSSSSKRRKSSQTFHHRNKDASSFFHGERRANRPRIFKTYSTRSVDGVAGRDHRPEQHVLTQPATEPYIPGRTVIAVPDEKDREFGELIRRALVFSVIRNGVNGLINSHHDVSDYSTSAGSDIGTSEMHMKNNVSTPEIFESNDNLTDSDISMNTTGTVGNVENTAVNTFSSEFSVDDTANNQGSNEETNIHSSYKISDEDLQTLTEMLFAKQMVISMWLTLNLQNKSENFIDDSAQEPLIYVQEEAYAYPTILAIRKLYDNYEHNFTVKETRMLPKRRRESGLLNSLLHSQVMTTAMQWLSERGFIDYFERKDILRYIWFNQFDGVTSGFERVFTSERYGSDILGVQDWIYFNYQESKNRINYMGYVDTLKLGDKASLVKLNFQMDDVIRPNATIFVGTTPELEMSLYTICFYARPNDLCPVSLGGTKFNIFTHSFRYHGKDMIDLALPIF